MLINFDLIIRGDKKMQLNKCFGYKDFRVKRCCVTESSGEKKWQDKNLCVNIFLSEQNMVTRSVRKDNYSI